MGEDRLKVNDYLSRQNFSDREIKNLHQGKQEYREESDDVGSDWGAVIHQHVGD